MCVYVCVCDFLWLFVSHFFTIHFILEVVSSRS